MFKIHSVFAIFLLVMFTAVSAAWGADVSGDWELTTESPRGERTSTISIVQNGEKITVTMEGRGGEMTCEGTIKENKIEWSITRETPRDEFTMTYTGSVDGNTMTGEVERGNRTTKWSAKKK